MRLPPNAPIFACMFAKPTVNDHLNQVRERLEEGRLKLEREINRIQSEFSTHGAFGGSRMFQVLAEAIQTEFGVTVRAVLGELRRSVVWLKRSIRRTFAVSLSSSWKATHVRCGQGRASYVTARITTPNNEPHRTTSFLLPTLWASDCRACFANSTLDSWTMHYRRRLA